MNAERRRSTRVVTFSLSPEEATEFDALAQAEGRNKSEMFREMVRIYRIWHETRRFESLQRHFSGRAREIGVTTEEDVERLIHEFRSEHRS